MKQEHWPLLLDIVNGKVPPKPIAGFIIDSPWLPGWYGISTLQYYSSEKLWFEANMHAISKFPDVIFLPGFWSEFGMCTEPSAFGAKTIWTQHALPHADRIMHDISEASQIKEPNPKTDGLLPFVLQRLVNYRPEIRNAGCDIRFAIARGPLNIASFLLGTTELMMAMMMDPENTHRLLKTITSFTINWLQLQKETIPEIDGILLLDDIVGFVGDDECREFAVPYLKQIFAAFDSSVRFFHNDAQGLISTPYLHEIGVNLFNFSFEHSLEEIRKLAGPEVALLGNLPPRDVMAAGTPEQVFDETVKMVKSINDHSGILWSVGGGMPPGVNTANIEAFISALIQKG
ncbi:MAG TPA: uroporphyrinogen decarboxylase [Prolixibacteraceae bacterium]|nr:uroporphyrinogen decarboxylase [Prolixibacteraceae bacterium]